MDNVMNAKKETFVKYNLSILFLGIICIVIIFKYFTNSTVLQSGSPNFQTRGNWMRYLTYLRKNALMTND